MYTSKTYAKIREHFPVGKIITPKDLIAIGIKRGTAYTFLSKHSGREGKTYFLKIGRGKYKIIH